MNTSSISETKPFSFTRYFVPQQGFSLEKVCVLANTLFQKIKAVIQSAFSKIQVWYFTANTNSRIEQLILPDPVVCLTLNPAPKEMRVSAQPTEPAILEQQIQEPIVLEQQIAEPAIREQQTQEPIVLKQPFDISILYPCDLSYPLTVELNYENSEQTIAKDQAKLHFISNALQTALTYQKTLFLVLTSATLAAFKITRFSR